ncbi:hypothetical protein SADUNF_Sadunf06G0124800 [Salix dunnii]|uniref:SUEL-type lectin domain-containing protein n=1 Tax=Salix dunnii TaxID=1413687 RepID=A0A835K903_9ROSI|nr:hypothetical protein SADUNF_Sadunf06G0124800 [Salix dunnii]
MELPVLQKPRRYILGEFLSYIITAELLVFHKLYATDTRNPFQNCVGKQSCSVTVVAEVFGGDPCPDSAKKLSVEAVCS